MRPFAFTAASVIALAALLLLMPAARPCQAQNSPDAPAELPDFTRFSLEELKNVEIISASKKPEPLSDTPAAVFVITQEDIRRSGATSIPEALRMATGVQVARITATDWAINIRGLNNRFAQNLLVLIDGRSVYSHVFSGVFWDIQDTLMEDIDRIEVIRGPGAALWGANAVNGVINIITKNAAETQGGRADVLGGNQEQIASLRYGGTFLGDGHYRVFGKFFNRGKLSGVVNSFKNETFESPQEAQQSKEWRSGRLGFRADLAPGQGLPSASENFFSLEGETYSNRYDKEIERQSVTFPFSTITRTDSSEATGGYLLGRWHRALSASSDTTVQAYAEKSTKDYDPSSGDIGLADLDFQHHFGLGGRQDILWGFEYRYISDDFDNSESVKMAPQKRDLNLLSTFVQDEIRLLPDRLTLTLGSKFEDNYFTGLEIQPSIRLLYTPHPKHVLWAALSRAVRTPSRLEHDGLTETFAPLNGDSEPPVEIITMGNSDLESEKLTAVELGYRIIPLSSLYLDATVFYNQYADLIGFGPAELAQEGGPYVLRYENNANGNSWGVELTADWRAAENWRLSGSYTFLRTDIDRIESGQPAIDALLRQAEGSNPRNLFSLRSMYNITPRIDFDLWLRYVDSLPEKEVDSYTTLDARIAWRVTRNIELSLVGQNLFEKGHAEFSSLQVERSVYGKIDWRF